MAASRADPALADGPAHFRSIPWCAKHLDQPGTVIIDERRRRARPDHFDSLFSQTLKTSEAIPAFVTSYRPPQDPEARVTEIRAFLTLGTGLNGYASICHGGMVAAIFDEVLGLLEAVNHGRGPVGTGTPLMTRSLNTTFLRPVRTPGTVMATAWIRKIEGRKWFLEAQLEEQTGTVLAKADALFLVVKGKL